MEIDLLGKGPGPLEPVSSPLHLWQGNPIFFAAGVEVCAHMAAEHPVEIRPPGALLVERGCMSDRLFVLLQGTARIFHRTADGREAIVKLLRAPNIFGDIELFHALPLLESVAAVDTVTIATIPTQRYLEFLEEHPQAMMAHLRHLSAAFCVAARNERQVFAPLKQKVANLLLSFATYFGRPLGREIEVAQGLSQSDIAKSLGASLRSVALVVSELKQRKLVAQRQEHFVILDREELAALAAPIAHSFCYHMGISLHSLAEEPDACKPRLVVTSGADGLTRTRYAVGESLLVGSAPDCDVVLPVPGVAPRHCRIFCGSRGPRYWVEDLGSHQGTWVNGSKIKRRVVENGTQITVGEAILRVEMAAK